MLSAIQKYAYHVFIVFGKRIERLHGAYWNIELATHFYYTYYSFIAKLKKDKHLRSMNISNYISSEIQQLTTNL